MKELEEEVHPWMFILVSILCLATARCHGQGSVHITFDGYPFLKPGTAAFVQQYSEGGVWFRPLGLIAPGNGFVRRASSPSSGWPDSGTAYVQAGLGDSLAFSFADQSLFDLVAVDLAEFSDVLAAPVTVHFTGYRHDGSTVTTDLTTNGGLDVNGRPDFQTFRFGPEFSGLDRVEIPTSPWSLDNLVLAIPEPAPSSLLLLALALAATFRSERSKGAPKG